MPMPAPATPTTAQRHAHYDDFVAHTRNLCTTPRIRADLARGQGRPAKECLHIHRYLARLVAGWGARRAHYTVAALIALEPPNPHAAHLAPRGPQVHHATPVPWHRRPNLGAALAQAAACRPVSAVALERKLNTLVHLSADHLHPLLPGLANQLLHTGGRPDWAVWLSDLALWDIDRLAVASGWLGAFHLDGPDDNRDEQEH
ncbi:type I-E CRISPR-associated protein Cse2/CasB [Streptomyces sp. CB01635]|uniref:type I-E CRISPR-associated protein Cse2/CasB n=1 Tax=unclassified Streptomyces TaxID=2593676 RepID=UPI0022784C24|nr:type I-E CRISPR-associated protein Cse2/CasB [Streptomyces sp. CB01635]